MSKKVVRRTRKENRTAKLKNGPPSAAAPAKNLCLDVKKRLGPNTPGKLAVQVKELRKRFRDFFLELLANTEIKTIVFGFSISQTGERLFGPAAGFYVALKGDLKNKVRPHWATAEIRKRYGIRRSDERHCKTVRDCRMYFDYSAGRKYLDDFLKLLSSRAEQTRESFYLKFYLEGSKESYDD